MRATGLAERDEVEDQPAEDDEPHADRREGLAEGLEDQDERERRTAG